MALFLVYISPRRPVAHPPRLFFSGFYLAIYPHEIYGASGKTIDR
jgi:hypothetical protein